MVASTLQPMRFLPIANEVVHTFGDFPRIGRRRGTNDRGEDVCVENVQWYPGKNAPVPQLTGPISE
jgi:hypothetical protein